MQHAVSIFLLSRSAQLIEALVHNAILQSTSLKDLRDDLERTDQDDEASRAHKFNCQKFIYLNQRPQTSRSGSSFFNSHVATYNF